MRRWILIASLASTSCFRADFLKDTICTKSSDCAPSYVCVFPEMESTSDEGPVRTQDTTGSDTTTGASDTGTVVLGQCGVPQHYSTVTGHASDTGTGTSSGTGTN